MAENTAKEYRWNGIPTRKSWRMKLLSAIHVGDTLAIIIALLASHYIKFGASNPDIDGRNDIHLSYLTLGIIIAISWYIMLQLSGSRSLRVLGEGNTEYRTIIKATTYLYTFIIICSYFTLADFARRYIFVAYPLGIALLILERYIIRRKLVKMRLRGRMLTNVLIIADASSGKHVEDRLRSAKGSGLNPVAYYLAGHENIQRVENSELPVLGSATSASDIISVIKENNIHAVIISSGHLMTPVENRELGWELARHGVSLILAPALTDISGPRIHTRPVNGLPFIHVSTPRLGGFQGAVKRSIDIVGSGLGLILISPIMLILALIIKKDGGPVFYSQSRIGLGGQPFNMWKFRSMVTNADELKQQLIEQNGGSALLFKMENDPRITPIGRFIRRYSIDELPQLWNVFLGDMSLIGPRPQVQAEVDLYTDAAYRRLMVRPGMTGLWQVSGRSNLTWEEAMRLDLYYVENWSLLTDLTILAKTVKAVVGKDGAY